MGGRATCPTGSLLHANMDLIAVSLILSSSVLQQSQQPFVAIEIHRASAVEIHPPPADEIHAVSALKLDLVPGYRSSVWS
ncbi:hypothetical protein EJB05_01467 [Eragrostis curvula]|uniref:Uncharacterized protein n=1 Tax=Eragrostis curvula TaxID=38414 RepID=A0A5J9WRY3_9POAL|nr:hypothetical protein EJB05_01467 [Eragrostis curvula]